MYLGQIPRILIGVAPSAEPRAPCAEPRLSREALCAAGSAGRSAGEQTESENAKIN